MAITVGRIEYIVGADGRVLEKESRDAARKAGKDSGKVYSDEMLESFRRKWGDASGFEKTLGAHDKKVVEQFRKLGGFTSKAYATRFEKTVIPMYRGTANKLVRMFASLTDNFKVIDLEKNFKGAPEMEAALRRTKALMDELSGAFEMGLAETPAGLDLAFLNKYRAELDKTLGLLEDSAAAEEARQQVMARAASTTQQATDASERYQDMTKKEIKAAVAHADAHEKEIAARLKGFEVLREETFQRITAKQAVIEEQKAYLENESALRQQTLARTNELQAQLREITQGRELDELGKKKLKQANKIIDALEREAVVRTDANKKISDSLTSVRKALVGNEQAVTNWLVSLDDLSIVVANTQREYDHVINTWDDMIQAQKKIIAAHKEHKASLVGVTAAVEEQVQAVARVREVTLQAVEANEELVESTRHHGIALRDSAGAITAMVEDIDAYDHGLQRATRSQNEFTEGVREGSLERLTRFGAFMFQYRQSLDEVTRSQNEANASMRPLAQAFDYFNAPLLRARTSLHDFIDTQSDAGNGLTTWNRGLNFASAALASFNSLIGRNADETDNATKKTNVFGNALSALGDKLKNFGNRGDLTPRIIAAIVAVLGEPIAALASAAGAGLLALAGGAAAAAIGVGTMITAFSVLNDDLDTLPASLRGVAAEFQAFQKVAGTLRLDIAAAAFEEMEGSFPRLGKSLQALTPAFQEVARVGGKAFDSLSRAVQPGTEAFEELETLILNAAPLFETMSGTIGTFSLAFVKGFNKANPLVRDLVGWIDTLAKRFKAFVDGPGFDDWIGHAETVFAALGPLLDVTSRTLNNLVTDAAIARTAEFLDNLTKFMPALGELITIFGDLDVLGLVSQLLVDLADALAPLSEPLQELADIISTQLGAAIEGFAAVIGAAAPFMAAWARGMADLLGVVPPGLVTSVAAALTLLAGALAALVAVRGLSTLTGAVTTLMTSLGAGPGLIAGTSKLMRTLGKAGLAGAAAVGVLALAEGLDQLYKEFTDLDDRARDAVVNNKSLTSSYEEFGKSVFGVTSPLTDVQFALDNLTGSGAVGMVGSIGNAFKLGGNQANQLSQALGAIGPALATLADSDLPAVQAQFRGMVDEMGASDAQAQNMLDTMGPEFKQVMQLAADEIYGTASQSQVLDVALGRVDTSATGVTKEVKKLTPEMEKMAENTQLAADALEVLKGRSVDALKGVEGVTEGIKTLGSAFRDQEGANIGYHQSIEDVRKALEDNGRVWDITTQAGRDNRSAIMDLAQSTLDYASEIYNMTGSQEDAAAAIDAGRQSVIKALEGMDLGGLSAEEYADKLGLIPSDVTTLVSANTAAGLEMADAFATRLYELGLLKVNPVVELEKTKAEEEIETTRFKLHSLIEDPYVATIDTDTEPAKTNTAAMDVILRGLAATTFTPTIDALNKPALDKTKAVVDPLKVLDASTWTTDIFVNNGSALANTQAVKTALDGVKSKTVTLTVQTSAFNQPVYRTADGRLLTAAGGMFDGAQYRIIAEAGPEAVVPLNRPLSRVDPSVRALSAFAQGLTPMAQRFGSTPEGGGRTVNISPGAITIQGTLQPEATATNVVNRIAQRIGG